MGSSTVAPIGYYVHHHGTGHLRTARNIVANMTRPVVLFSTLAAPDDLPAHVTYVQLPSDVVPDYAQPSDSVFHYTPYDDQIFTRYQTLIDAWKTYAIRHMHVDVSMEIAVLAKLFGLSVSHTVLHGIRTDVAHTFGYGASDVLIAHMPASFDLPENRQSTTPVRYCGGMSRFKARPFEPLTSCKQVAVMVSPQAEQSVVTAVRTLAQTTPDTTWHCIGFDMQQPLANVQAHGVVPDPLPILDAADVIIGTGGNNTIMEIASLGKPFVCIPEARPYDEQVIAAASLEQLRAAVYARQFPTPETWPDVLDQLRDIDGNALTSLVSDTASADAARLLESAADASRL